MGKFAYKGIDSNGAAVFGIVEADNEADAISEIGRRGFFIEEIRAAGAADEWRVRRDEARKQREVQIGRQQELAKKQRQRQRLVVRYADGKCKYGVCYALSPRDTGFHLDIVDGQGAASGHVEQVRFSDLKAVFYVKSFDGKYDKRIKHRDWTPEGSEIVVEFKDGETVRGYSLHVYDASEPRFYLVPCDEETNNISILVEAAAVKAVCSPQEYEERQAREKEARKTSEGADDFSQEETMGDFCFETRNYAGALAQYQAAAKRNPKSSRLRRKILASEYNIGVQFIKTREYDKALAYMERILKIDPKNPHARKKVQQLRRIVERGHRDKDREKPEADEY